MTFVQCFQGRLELPFALIRIAFVCTPRSSVCSMLVALVFARTSFHRGCPTQHCLDNPFSMVPRVLQSQQRRTIMSRPVEELCNNMSAKHCSPTPLRAIRNSQRTTSRLRARLPRICRMVWRGGCGLGGCHGRCRAVVLNPLLPLWSCIFVNRNLRSGY